MAPHLGVLRQTFSTVNAFLQLCVGTIARDNQSARQFETGCCWVCGECAQNLFHWLVKVDRHNTRICGKRRLRHLWEVLPWVGLEFFDKDTVGGNLAKNLSPRNSTPSAQVEMKLGSVHKRRNRIRGTQTTRARPRTCRSAEHETPRPTGHDAPCLGSRITRTSWQKYCA